MPGGLHGDLTVTGGPHGVSTVPMLPGGPHGDRRVPTVSPWRQEDLMVTGGPHGVQEGPTVSVLSLQCQEDLTVTEGSPRCPHGGGRTSR